MRKREGQHAGMGWHQEKPVPVSLSPRWAAALSEWQKQKEGGGECAREREAKNTNCDTPWRTVRWLWEGRRALAQSSSGSTAWLRDRAPGQSESVSVGPSATRQKKTEEGDSR